ncbi:c-type cytochrome [Endothiovibrio diazotrophicus]
MRHPIHLAALLLALTALPALADDTLILYQQHCAACHGGGRLGGAGPALLPENLGRLTPQATVEVIAHDPAPPPRWPASPTN